MTIDEAIEHCEEIAQDCELGEKPTVCADEHRQLAEWLRELKEYKTKNQENNEPLTWEELKKLKGKPVWVEEKYSFSDGWYGQWEVIDEFWDDIYFYDEPYVSMTDEENRRKDDLGKKWNAYRREKKSEDE